MIEDNIRTYLLTQSPITALVGTDSAGSPARIFAVDRRQGITADSIIYERLGTERDPMLASAQGAAEALLEFDCVSPTYAGAKALGNALRGELDGFRGAMGDATIHWCSLDDESDDYDPPADGSARGQFHQLLTFRVQYLESIPAFA